MLVGMYQRGVRPDAVVFADTGGELPETYRFIEGFSLWLLDRGFPEITVVRSEGKTLEKDCLDRKTLPSVAFGRQFKSCSDRWKRRPIDRWISSWEPAVKAWEGGKRVIKLIGFDSGEPHRVKDFSDPKFWIEYPLVSWGWNRRKCVEICAAEGLLPGKSSCFFCPNRKKGEVLRLVGSHPELAERAFAMERNNATNIPGLGRDWRWEDFVRADQGQQKLFADYSEEMPCGCYDGGAD